MKIIRDSGELQKVRRLSSTYLVLAGHGLSQETVTLLQTLLILLNFSPRSVVYILESPEDVQRVIGEIGVSYIPENSPGLVYKGPSYEPFAVFVFVKEITQEDEKANLARAKEKFAQQRRALEKERAGKVRQVSEVRKSPRVRTPEDAADFLPLIGEDNYEAIERAVRDGAEIWIFLSEGEIHADPDLKEEEKADCLRRLCEEDLGYAGFVRGKAVANCTSVVNPWLTPSPSYDTHGNSRGGGWGSPSGWSWAH